MPQPINMTLEPEIVSPAAYERLENLTGKHQDEAIQLRRLEALADLLDTRFKVPFLPVPIGLDSIIGLIPGVGDTISVGLSGFIVVESYRLGLPKRYLARMCGNILIDWIVGLVPIIGDLFDIGWRGNIRNVKIVRDALEKKWALEKAAILQG